MYLRRRSACRDRSPEQSFTSQQALGLLPADAELSEPDPDVPAWDSLSEDERRMYARQMETYAAFLEQTDHHFGRVVDFVGAWVSWTTR